MNQQVKTGLGIAIIVILAATAAFFTWKAQKNNQEATNTQARPQTTTLEQMGNSQANTNLITNDSYGTSDWIEFINEKHGYSFKYPKKGWYIYEHIDDESGADIIDILANNSRDGGTHINVSTADLQTEINNFLDSYKNSNGNFVYERDDYYESYDYIETCKKSDIKFLNIDAIQIDCATKTKQGRPTYSDEKIIFFSKDMHTYELAGITKDYEKYSGIDEGIFDAILSSFKFNQAKNLKTYENKTYKFSIQYPFDYFYKEEQIEEGPGGVIYNITFGKNPEDWENSISINVANILSDKLMPPNGMDPRYGGNIIIGGEEGINYNNDTFVVSDNKHRFEIISFQKSLEGALKNMVASFKFIK